MLEDITIVSEEIQQQNKYFGKAKVALLAIDTHLSPAHFDMFTSGRSSKL